MNVSAGQANLDAITRESMLSYVLRRARHRLHAPCGRGVSRNAFTATPGKRGEPTGITGHLNIRCNRAFSNFHYGESGVAQTSIQSGSFPI